MMYKEYIKETITTFSPLALMFSLQEAHTDGLGSPRKEEEGSVTLGSFLYKRPHPLDSFLKVHFLSTTPHIHI